jgi:hypoxanthine phosphoribosyltransferase
MGNIISCLFPYNNYNKLEEDKKMAYNKNTSELTKLWIKYANKKNKTTEEEEFYNYLHCQLFDID